MARILKIHLEQNQDKSITYIDRNRGETGLDIMAVKHALGLINYTNEFANNSVQDAAIQRGPQWFSCIDNTEISVEKASRFDRFLEATLMKFQLDNQFTIINYYFTKYSVPNILRFQAQDLDLTDAQKEVIKGKQLAAAEKLFDSEFGKIGEGTLSLLHGWLNKTVFGNTSYYHEGPYNCDVIPLVIYDNFVKERYSQKPDPDSDITDPTVRALPSQEITPDVIYDSEVDSGKYERYPWTRIIKPKKIEVKKRSEEDKSALYSATEAVFQLLATIPANQRDVNSLTDQESLDLINRHLEPDPNTNPEPFELDSNHYLVFVDTEYSYQRNPPSNISEVELREYEDLALHKIINFFNKPNVWSPDPDDPMFALSYPNVLEQALTASSNGSLSLSEDRFVLTTNTHLEQNKSLSGSVQTYDEIDEDKFSSFKEFRNPTLRPGDVYKASVIIDRRKLDLIVAGSIKQISELPQASASPVTRFESAASELSDQYCAFLDMKNRNITEENSVRFKEYKAFAKIQRRQILRTIKQKVLEETSKEFTGEPGDISMDLGVFGQYRVDGASVFDALRGSIDSLSTGFSNPEAALPLGKTLFDPEEPGPNSLKFSNFADLVAHIDELVEFFDRSREGIDKVVFSDPSFSIDTEISFLRQIPSTIKNQITRIRSSDPTILAGRTNKQIFETGLGTIFKFNVSYEFRFDQFGDFELFVDGEEIGSVEGFDTESTPPFNRPRTVNYFRNVNAIIGEDILGGFLTKTSGDCFQSGTLVGRINTILKYTEDLSLLSKDSVFDPLHQYWQQKTGELAEWYRQDGAGSGTAADAVLGIAGLGTSVQYGAALALPILSDKCDQEAIKEKFLKRFSLPLLLCDVFKCLKMPPINIKAPDFDLPELPTWDPFSLDDFADFFKKMKDIFLQLLKKIVCAYAEGILDILNTPFCGTNLEEQVLIPEINSEFELPRRALLEALTDLGIPKTLEATDQAKELFSDLANVLTPSELCALLAGEEVSSEVYAIVSRLAKEKNLIFNNFQNRESIKNFFDTIGIFIDEDLCDQLGDFDEQLGTYTCEDTAALMRLLREKLIRDDVTTPEIEAALAAAQNDLLDRAKALEVISDTNALSKLFPGTITPGAEGSPLQELPQSVATAANATIQALTTPVKFSYLSSLRSFGNSFYMESPNIPQPGDANYNGTAVLELERSLERIRTYNEALLENPTILEDGDLDEINSLLNMLCAIYQQDSTGNEPPIHRKFYIIRNGSGEEVVSETRFTSQAELNRVLNQYNQDAGATDGLHQVEVFLKKAGVDNSLKYPIELPNILFVTQESTSGDENISKIRDNQHYARIRDRSNLSDFEKQTVKLGMLDKINERLLATKQGVVNNLENATRTSFDSELLKNLKEIFDSNEEAIREFGRNELINVVKETSGNIVLTAKDSTSQTEVKYSVLPNAITHEKYAINIKDPNSFTGEANLIFCTKIPDNVIEDILITPGQTKDESFFKVFKKSFVDAISNSETNISPNLINQFLDDKRNIIKNNMFPAVTEGIFEQLFFEFYQSDIFQEEFVDRISRLVAGELFLSETDSGNLCITNKFELNSDSDLSFERIIIKDYLAEIMDEFAKKENDVSNIDYSQLTATEKATANLIVRALVRISILEVALKSSINLSVFSFTEMISTYEFREYLNQICVRNILSVPAFSNPETYKQLEKSVKRVSGQSAIKQGLIKTINEEIFTIASIIDKIYDKDSTTGSMFSFYINNLQSLSIPSEKNEQGKWLLDPSLTPAKVNPFIYFENYIKLNGPLADPDIFRTPISFRLAHERFFAESDPVYDPINIEPPNLDYLLNYINDIDSSDVSFLNDQTKDKEIISITDFRKLLEAVKGGGDSMFAKAERDVKMLFQFGPLKGRPKFFTNTAAAAYKIERNFFKFNKPAINRNSNQYQSFSDSSTGLDQIVASLVDINSSPGSTTNYYIESVDGKVLLKEPLTVNNVPVWNQDYDDVSIDNPYMKCLEQIDGIKVINDGTNAEPIARGITRKINLKQPDSRVGFTITNDDGETVFEENNYGPVTRETFNSYPDNMKINIQEVVMDLVDDASPIYDGLGEIDAGYTTADWNRLIFPANYKNNMQILKQLMLDDDPDFRDSDAGPFKFGGETGCFVPGVFGLTLYENPDDHRTKLPPNDFPDYAAVRQKRFSFRVGKYMHGILEDHKRAHHLMINDLSSDHVLNGKTRRFIFDNQYEIPTRILLTRYNVDEFMGTASECYVKFMIPTFLESRDAIQQAQTVVAAWSTLVNDYIQNVKQAFMFIISSEELMTEQELESDLITVVGDMSTPTQMKIAYNFVKSKCPEFPVFYNKYRYVREQDFTAGEVPLEKKFDLSYPIEPRSHWQMDGEGRFQRKNFFNREKLLKEICSFEPNQEAGAFAVQGGKVTKMFEDRGLLLKTLVPHKNHADTSVAGSLQVYRDTKARPAGSFYFRDPCLVLRRFSSIEPANGNLDIINNNNALLEVRDAYEIRSSIANLIYWFSQRRKDSIWGRTYTSRTQKSPNYKIEKPGIACGMSPFYADGRTSMTELRMIMTGINKRIIDKYTESSIQATQKMNEVVEIYHKTILSAKEQFQEWLDKYIFPTGTTGLDEARVRRLSNENSLRGNVGTAQAYLLTFGLEDATHVAREAATEFAGLKTDNPERKSYIFPNMRVHGAGVTYDRTTQYTDPVTGDLYLRYSDPQAGGTSPNSSPPIKPSPHRVVTGRLPRLDYGNNMLAIHYDSYDKYVPFNKNNVEDIMRTGPFYLGEAAQTFNQLADYGIFYESDKLQESPVHNLNIIGIDTSKYESLKGLYRPGAELYGQTPMSAILFSFATSRAMRQIDRAGPIFNQFREAAEFASSIEAQYIRALDTVGIGRLVRILYNALTDQGGSSGQFLFDQYLMNTEISHGIRVMMGVPSRSDSSLDLSSNRTAQRLSSLNALLEEQRMGDVLTATGDEIETYFLTNYEEVIDLTDPCWNLATIEQLEERFEEKAEHRFERIQEEQMFQTYFNYLIPINALTSTAAIYNTSLLGSYNTFPLLFDSTKNMLGTVFYEAVKKTMLPSGTMQDTTLQDLGLSVLDGANVFDTTAKNARPGGSKRGDCDLFPVDFGTYINMLADMLEEFIKFIPSMILRGIANSIDPAYREMKHHWNSCNLDGFSFYGPGQGKPLIYYTGERKLDLGMTNRNRDQTGRYAPVNIAFITDLFGALTGVPFNWVQLGRSVDKLVTYIYSGQLPMLDPSWAFQIPCVDVDNAGDDMGDWSKYKFGNNGRYGHPVTPFTYLALATPIMRRDLKDQRFRCKVIKDGALSNNTSRADLEEC